jgi:hypothetical protein
MTGKELGAQPAFPVIGVPGYGASVPVVLPGGQRDWAVCGGGLTKREWLVGQVAASALAEVRKEFTEGEGESMSDWGSAVQNTARSVVLIANEMLEELAK